MARANRLRVQGGIFHLTHRCHNRDFLLKFDQDRRVYRDWMREKLARFEVILDLERLCWRLGTLRLEEVQKNLQASLQEATARDEMKRQACWTESLAVGSPAFLERMQGLILSRRETEIVEQECNF